MEAVVAGVEHPGVQLGADVGGLPVGGTLGVLELGAQGPGLVAGDGGAQRPEDRAGEVEGRVGGGPGHHGAELPGFMGLNSSYSSGSFSSMSFTTDPDMRVMPPGAMALART